MDMGRLRRSRQSKSLQEVAASIRGFANKSMRLVKVFRMLLAVTGAKSMMSAIARTHGALRGYFPFWRPPIVRFQCAENPSASEAMDWRSTSPKVGGNDGVSRT